MTNEYTRPEARCMANWAEIYRKPAQLSGSEEERVACTRVAGELDEAAQSYERGKPMGMERVRRVGEILTPSTVRLKRFSSALRPGPN
ncbi:MAG: hypothetical protein ABIH92_05310 [Nanoarchaeota archaeon]